MAKVTEVAKFILEKLGPTSAMKLQKLVYYSQAWSLVWDDKALFRNKIEAWANGPVVRSLYSLHRGQFKVKASDLSADSSNLNTDQVETIEAVLSYYGDKNAQWLSDLTHMENPWKLARKRAGLDDGESGDTEIKLADMAEYYESISLH